MLILLNLLCYSNGAAGPFKHSRHANHWAVALLFLLVCIVLWGVHEKKRRGEGGEALPAAPILLYRKCLVFLIVYLLFIVFVYFVSRVGVYPGKFYDLGGGHDDGSGVVFSFTSSYDGGALKGYRLRVGDLTSSQPALPVIFYGGNGQYMYSNVYAGFTFLEGGELGGQRLNRTFDIYSFSYRGYTPNAGWTSEDANIADSISLYRHVVKSYPGVRPMVFAHSLGTGAALAVAAFASQADDSLPLLSCLGLGMPFSTMAQTTLEISYYADLLWLYAAPQWNSLARAAQVDENIPSAVLSAGQDELIAPHHQQKIYDALPSKVKRIFYLQNGNHNSIWKVLLKNGVAYSSWFWGQCMN